MAGVQDRVFHCYIPWGPLVAIVAGMMISVFFFTVGVRLLVQVSALDMAEARARLVLMVIVYAAFLLYFAASAFVRILSARRAGVRVDEAGIGITNWRGREVFLDWSHVRRLRVSTYGSHVPVSMSVQSGDQGYPLCSSLRHSDELRDEIIARAGLEMISQSLWRTVYSKQKELSEIGDR